MLQPVDQELIRGVVHVPDKASGDGLVLTHGAGSNCNTPLLVALADVFARSGWTVLRCDLPFRQKRSFGPPRGSAAEDQEGLRRAVFYMRTQVAGRICLGGHSYGGRQASMLAASQTDVAEALLLLSYPLHPPKRPTELRTAHFPQLRTPALFVHGSRDGFGRHEELAEAVELIPSKTEIFEIVGTGHEILSKKNASTVPQEIAARFEDFLRNQ